MDKIEHYKEEKEMIFESPNQAKEFDNFLTKGLFLDQPQGITLYRASLLGLALIKTSAYNTPDFINKLSNYMTEINGVAGARSMTYKITDWVIGDYHEFDVSITTGAKWQKEIKEVLSVDNIDCCSLFIKHSHFNSYTLIDNVKHELSREVERIMENPFSSRAIDLYYLYTRGVKLKISFYVEFDYKVPTFIDFILNRKHDYPMKVFNTGIETNLNMYNLESPKRKNLFNLFTNID